MVGSPWMLRMETWYKVREVFMLWMMRTADRFISRGVISSGN